MIVDMNMMRLNNFPIAHQQFRQSLIGGAKIIKKIL